MFFSCSGRQKARETNKMFVAGGGKGHGVFFHFVLEGLRGAPGATDDDGRVTWDRLVPFVKERVKKANATWFTDLPEAEWQVPFAIGSTGDVPPLALAPARKPGVITPPDRERTSPEIATAAGPKGPVAKPDVSAGGLKPGAVWEGVSIQGNRRFAFSMHVLERSGAEVTGEIRTPTPKGLAVMTFAGTVKDGTFILVESEKDSRGVMFPTVCTGKIDGSKYAGTWKSRVHAETGAFTLELKK